MHLTWYKRNKHDLLASLCKEWFYNLCELISVFNCVTVNLTVQLDVSRLQKSRTFSSPRILLQLLQVQSFYFPPIITILSKSMYQYEFFVLVVMHVFRWRKIVHFKNSIKYSNTQSIFQKADRNVATSFYFNSVRSCFDLVLSEFFRDF